MIVCLDDTSTPHHHKIIRHIKFIHLNIKQDAKGKENIERVN